MNTFRGQKWKVYLGSVKKHGVFFHLIRFSFVSFSSVCKFSSFRSYTFLKFIPYFIFLVIINGAFSSIASNWFLFVCVKAIDVIIFTYPILNSFIIYSSFSFQFILLAFPNKKLYYLQIILSPLKFLYLWDLFFYQMHWLEHQYSAK